MTSQRFGCPRVVALAGPHYHHGMCEPSAAVGVAVPGRGLAFLVAGDEDNVLRAFLADSDEAVPVRGDPLGRLLHPEEPGAGVDIEGSARIGRRVYWIASHGRSAKGKPSEHRRRFFATDLSVEAEGIAVTAVVPKRLDLGLRDALRHLGIAQLTAAIGPPEADGQKRPELAPEKGGLNIEGLTEGVEKGTLLLGLRSPLLDERAMAVPFLNPDAAVAGEPPQLGQPILLDLGGRGIRSMDRIEARGGYLVIAGPAKTEGKFTLFAWSGLQDELPVEVGGAAKVFACIGRLAGPEPGFAPFRFNPEAAVVSPDGTRVDLLSDDGDWPVGEDRLQDLPEARHCFRSLTLHLAWDGGGC